MSGGFMYLKLYHDDDTRDRVRVQVVTEGELTRKSVGSKNSRLSIGPFAVFQIDSFTGIEAINDDDLLNELFRRFSTKDLAQQLQIRMTDADLLEVIRDRLNA